MAITRGLGSVIFAGVAVVALAGPAWANPIFEGDYTYHGEGIERSWHATSCGLAYPCTHIDAPPVAGKAGFGGDAKIANTPFWILEVDNLPGTVVCADGSSAPGNIKYQWSIDPPFSGDASTWTTVGVCGDPPKSYGHFAFTLTKVSKPGAVRGRATFRRQSVRGAAQLSLCGRRCVAPSGCRCASA